LKVHLDSAEFFVPDDLPIEQALKRTTHMAIGAHQDDIEIMAAAPILECFQRSNKWFTGVVVTDGRGSPRDGLYENFTDEEMRRIRFKEQRKAAIVGEYAAQLILDYPSTIVKDSKNREPVEDLVEILEVAHPQFVFTHDLADKHDTHVSVALRVLAAMRMLPDTERPQKLYGCEVWRGLDWMIDADKVAFDLSAHENLQEALLGVHDSQICGGKRYDLATMGRRHANATYSESHGVDIAQGISYAMDLTPLIRGAEAAIIPFAEEHIRRFSMDVVDRLRRMS